MENPFRRNQALVAPSLMVLVISVNRYSMLYRFLYVSYSYCINLVYIETTFPFFFFFLENKS